MQRFGVHYDSRPRPGSGLQTRNERRYGITDVDEARRFGYGRPQLPAAAAPANSVQDPKVAAVLFGKNAARYTSRSANMRMWRGSTTRPTAPWAACRGQRRRAAAGMKRWSTSAADPRLRHVFANWSVCMKRAGFDYPTPLDVLQDRNC